MKIAVTIEINEELAEKIVRGIMDNFPEASHGASLVCVGYHYDEMRFEFQDQEERKQYTLTKHDLMKAFPLVFTDKWPKGCTQPPASTDWEVWEEWLCQADATDFDAFAQLAAMGEVIYG